MRLLAVTVICLLAPGLIQAGDFPVADLVVIEKDARKLHLLRGGEIFRTFGIALGLQPVGDKKQEGDLRTGVISSIGATRTASSFCRSEYRTRTLRIAAKPRRWVSTRAARS